MCARSFREGRTIVFFRTKQAAHRAKMLFGLAGLPPAAELHGNLTQAARLDALEKFRLVRGPHPVPVRPALSLCQSFNWTVARVGLPALQRKRLVWNGWGLG